ncbi:hypothetical protein BDW71DRAFT_190907 [Aspergillus fruticulosus]
MLKTDETQSLTFERCIRVVNVPFLCQLKNTLQTFLCVFTRALVSGIARTADSPSSIRLISSTILSFIFFFCLSVRSFVPSLMPSGKSADFPLCRRSSRPAFTHFT